MAQNELALQLYQLGFFNPMVADQALACLEIMDFDRKEFIIQKISQNSLMQQLLMMQQAQSTMGQPNTDVKDKEALGGDVDKESSHTAKARERVAESTSPT